MKKPLAALLLVPASVALAVPAGAATSPVTWEHRTLPCATGHKSATVTLKWRYGDVQKSWYTNPCSQWLLLGWLFPDSQSNGGSYDVAPHRKGQTLNGLNLFPSSLSARPDCTADAFLPRTPAACWS